MARPPRLPPWRRVPPRRRVRLGGRSPLPALPAFATLPALALALLIGLAGAAGVPDTAIAQEAEAVGPTISPGRIRVDSLVPRGARTEVPAVVIRNNGDDRLTVQMSATADPDDAPSAAATAWVRFTPGRFELAPGASQLVEVAVDVPRDADLADYRLRLKAGTPRDPAGGGLAVAVSLAVAAVLDFTVGDPPAGAAAGRYGSAAGLALAAGLGSFGYLVLAPLMAPLLTKGVRALPFRLRSPIERRPAEAARLADVPPAGAPPADPPSTKDATRS